jgi:hypothetical protein
MVLSWIVFAGAAVAAGAPQASQCIECHKDPAFRVQNKKLYDYYQEYEKSLHGLLEIDCEECHGGDAGTRQLPVAHAGVMKAVSYGQIPVTCGRCHQAQEQAYGGSKHAAVMQETGMAPNCVTCHGSMDMDFVLTSMVENACRFCHNQQTQNHPEVPDRAEFILNQVNTIKGYKSFVFKYSDDEVLQERIRSEYIELTRAWHAFDLDNVGPKATALLDRLRAEKARIIKARHGR